MKKPILLLGFLLFSGHAFSVLAPEYQNVKDIRSMLKTVEEDKRIAGGLELIDLQDKTISFRYQNDQCKAYFKRKSPPAERSGFFVGPAEPLVLDSICCDAGVFEQWPDDEHELN